MTPETLRAAAAHIAGHRRGPRRLGPLSPDMRPPSLADAYILQDEVHAALRPHHGAIAGHKIGCTTPVMQAYLGIDHPCAGGVFAASVHRGGARIPLDAFCRIGVECEIVALLGRDLDQQDAPYDRDSVAPAVAACAVGIELVDDRYVDYRSLDTETLVADDFFNAGIVIGTPVADWRELDLAALTGVAYVDGELRGSGRGADVLGHPLAALAWLANHRAERAMPLRAGEFVSTGSVVQTQWIDRPGQVVAMVDGLGRLELTFC